MPITPCLAEPLFFFFFSILSLGELERRLSQVNRLLGKYRPEFDLQHLHKRNPQTNNKLAEGACLCSPITGELETEDF